MGGLDPTPTDRLDDRYVLLERLGSGGMAVVYRAWDVQLEVFRAVKILSGVAHKPRVRQRLETEARTMARLAHPNVVSVHDTGDDLDRLYLVMDFVPGGTVMERVQQQGPLPPRMACGVVRGVLSALALAHEHGVIHRDIKPHNILLDADGVAKVTDFGIARIDLSSLTRTGAVLGTLAYMPPEQKLSARKVDARSDLYATGATLFALLTGREPFDLYAAGMDAEIAEDFFEGVPESLRAVIRRSTAFRMEDRFDDAPAMSAALTEAMVALPDDPLVPPLVAPERIARARADATMGPTLVGTTDSDIGPTTGGASFPSGRSGKALATTPIPGKVITPATTSERRRGSPLVWIVLALGAVVLLSPVLLVAGIGVWMWWPAPEQSEIAAPVSGGLGSPPVVSPQPSPDQRVDVAPVAVPVPARQPGPQPTDATGSPLVPMPEVDTVVTTTPAPVTGAPVPVPLPLPAPAPVLEGTSSGTGWSVDVITEAVDSAPRVVGTLLAEADVVDAKGVRGRPKLQAGCQKGRRWLTLDAGVESVNIVPMEAAGLDVPVTSVTVTTASGTDKRTLQVSKQVMTNILFKGAAIEDVLDSPEVTIAYYPFGATQPVTARFTNDGVERLRSTMAARCR